MRLGDGDAVDTEAVEFKVDEHLVKIGFLSCERKQTSRPLGEARCTFARALEADQYVVQPAYSGTYQVTRYNPNARWPWFVKPTDDEGIA